MRLGLGRLMSEFGLPPHLLAAADQDLAAVDEMTDRLVEAWRVVRLEFPGRDRAELVMAFMSEAWGLCGWSGVLAVAAVAVSRLAGEGL